MQRNPQAATLVIQVQTGVTAAGKPMVKSKSYPIIDPSATDDQVYAIGQAIASLQQEPAVAIERLDRAVLVATPASSTTP
ncbi:MAG: hypothetical protein JWN30_700 [Bacilli bacterium]|nr:hypothetical protein [Bacilli bacterium]